MAYTAPELLQAIQRCGFEPRRDSTGRVFLLNVQPELIEALEHATETLSAEAFDTSKFRAVIARARGL